MPIDWEKLYQKYGNREKEPSPGTDVKSMPETRQNKIIQFDMTHIPEYRTADNCLNHVPAKVRQNIIQFRTARVPEEYQKDAERYNAEKEKAIRAAKELQADGWKKDREQVYRISLVKGKEEDLNQILTKNINEWNRDAEEGKTVAEIVVSTPEQKMVGVPVPVNEFLASMKRDTLYETVKEEEGKKTYLIDAVYDRKDENGLEYHSSCIQDPQKDEHQNEPVFFSVRNNALMQMSDRPEELEAILKEANEELLDKDLYEFSDAGVVHDTTRMADAQHVTAQKYDRIQQAGAAEQERLEWGRDTGNKCPAPLDAVRDNEEANASGVPPRKEQYYSEFYNMPQDVGELPAEEAAMEKEVKEEQNDRQGTEAAKQNEQPVEEKQMSYRERIEAEDREFWEEDLERTY